MAQAHGDRLTAVDASFLAQEGPNSHMHIGAVMLFEGPPPAFDGLRRPRPRPPAPRAALPAEARGPAARDRPAAVGRRPELQPRVPPAPHRRCRSRAARSSCARSPPASTRSSSTARSRCGSCGSCRGSTDGRFALISKTHHALVDGIAGVDLATVLFDLEPVPPPVPHEGEPWVPQPRAERDRRWPRAACAGWSSCRSTSPAARSAPRRGPTASLHAAREAVEGVGRGRVGRAEPGARDAAQRADRPAPAVRDRALRAGRLQARQGRVRRHRQRRRARRRRGRACAAGCSRAACAPRGSSCARSCRSRSARADERGRMRQPARRHARAAAGLRRGPGRAAAGRARRRWTA